MAASSLAVLSWSTATYAYNNDNLVSQISYGSDVRTLGYDSLHRHA
jgi:hypothetical protein